MMEKFLLWVSLLIFLQSVFGKRELIIQNFRYNFDHKYLNYDHHVGTGQEDGIWFNSTIIPQKDLDHVYLNISLRTEDKSDPKSRIIYRESIDLCKPIPKKMLLLKKLFLDEEQEVPRSNFELQCPYSKGKDYRVYHRFPGIIDFPMNMRYNRFYVYGSIFRAVKKIPERILAINFCAIYRKLDQSKKRRMRRIFVSY